MDPKEKTTKKMETFELTLKSSESPIDVEKRTVNVIFSDESPIYRYAYYKGNYIECYVILSHDPGAVDLSRYNDKANLLWDHNDSTPIGVIEGALIDSMKKQGKCVVRFGKGDFASEKFNDYADGILTKFSVGCEPFDYDNDATLLGEHEGIPLFRMNKWSPFELSGVCIPANANAKVGLAMQGKEVPKADAANEARKAEEMAKAEEQKNKLKEIKMSDPIAEQKPVDVEAFRKEGREAEAIRQREIGAFADNFKSNAKIQDYARESKEKGTSFEDFARQAVKLNAEKPEPVSQVGMSKKEVESFDIMKVVRALYSGIRPDEMEGIEGESHRAIASKMSTQPRGYCLPNEIQKRKMDLSFLPEEYRAKVAEKFTVQVAGTGSYLVDQYHDAAGFVELLYAESLIPQLSPMMISGLVGDMDIPKLTTGHTIYSVAESTAGTKSNPVLGRVLLQPKTITGLSTVSRKMIKQATPAIRTILMADLASSIAETVDKYITQGTGSDSQPAGLAKALTDASISAINCTSMTYAKMLSFVTALKNAKAYKNGVRILTTPDIIAIPANTQKVANTFSPLYDYDSKRTIGIPTVDSANCKSGHLFAGNFSDMIVADWGAVELDMVEDTTNPNSGDKTLRAFFDFDLGIRRAASFQWTSSVTQA
jgi:HK97 family phage major capsid protein